MFSPWDNLFSFRAFSREEKDRNHLLQGLVNMVDGVEQTSLNEIFFLVWFLLNVTMHYHGQAQLFSFWWVLGVFLEDFHTNVESISLHWVSDCFPRRFSYKCWEYKSALSVWLWFKNLKCIILQWSHHRYSITFLPLGSAFGVGCGDLSISVYCLLHWTLS